jgi:hypothetical protein
MADDAYTWPPPEWGIAPTSDPTATGNEGWPPPEFEPAAPVIWPPPEWDATTAPSPQPEPGSEEAPLDMGIEDLSDSGAAAPWPPLEWQLPVLPGLPEEAAELAPGESPALDPGVARLRPPEAFLPEELAVPDVAIPEDTALRDEEAVRLGVRNLEAMTPDELIEMRVREQTAADERRAEEHAANERLRKQNLEELTRTQEAANRRTDAALRRAQELAERGEDPDRWMKSRTTGQRIAAYASAIIGGYLSPLRGGRNEGLQMILDAIDQDIESQRQDLAREERALGLEQGAVAEMVRHGLTQYQAAEASRMAAIQTLDARLAGEQAQRDPRGTQVRRIAQMRAELRDEQARSAEAIRKQAFEDQLKVTQEERKDRELAQRAADARAQRGLGYAQIRESRAAREAAAEERRLERERAQADAAGRTPTSLWNADGTPFTTGSDADDRRIRKETVDYQGLETAYSRLWNHLRKYEDAQGAINLGRLNSTEREVTAALANNVVKQAAKAGLGTISERSLEAFKDLLLGGDARQLTRADPLETLRVTRTADRDAIEARLKQEGFRGQIPAGTFEIDEVVSMTDPRAIKEADDARRLEEQRAEGLIDETRRVPLPESVADEIRQKRRLEEARHERVRPPEPAFDPSTLPGVRRR